MMPGKRRREKRHKHNWVFANRERFVDIDGTELIFSPNLLGFKRLGDEKPAIEERKEWLWVCECGKVKWVMERE